MKISWSDCLSSYAPGAIETPMGALSNDTVCCRFLIWLQLRERISALQNWREVHLVPTKKRFELNPVKPIAFSLKLV